MSTRFTNDDFIRAAKNRHGDKYDYSKVNYVNSNTPVSIICPEHGEFKQAPHNHIRGQGCPICANKLKGQYCKSSTQDFITKAKALHPNENFDYSKVNYQGNKTKVNITCPNGHLFSIRPNDFLMGHGCPICNSRLHVTEMGLYKKLKTLYPDAIHSYRPDWLHGKTSSQEIDIYIPSLNIGIEYQGRQHFIARSIFDGEDGLAKTQERDLRKYNKCKEHNMDLLYVSYEKNIPQNYFAPIYSDYDSLLDTIQKKNNISKINLTESDIRIMVKDIISSILNN